MYASIYDVTHQYSAYCYVQLLYIYGRDGAVAKDRSYLSIARRNITAASSRTVPIEEEECKNRMNTHAATNTPQHRSIRSRCTRTWEVSDLTVGVSPPPDRAASSRSRSRPPPSSFTHAMQASIFKTTITRPAAKARLEGRPMQDYLCPSWMDRSMS